MLKDHTKLLLLFKQVEELVGRKKLQKIVYIAKKLNFPYNERYKFHMFGPYSEELTLQIEELCNLGFILEQKENKSGYTQYRYTLTEEGTNFLSLYPLEISYLEQVVKSMNEQSSRFLELVSTLLYFEELSKEDAKKKVTSVKKKQNYTEEEMEQAYEYINTLKGIIQENVKKG